MKQFWIYFFTFTAGAGFVMLLVDIGTKLTTGKTAGGFNKSIPVFVVSIIFLLLWKFVF